MGIFPSSLSTYIRGQKGFDKEAFLALEEVLISSNLGVKLSEELLQKLQKSQKKNLKEALSDALELILLPLQRPWIMPSKKPFCVMFIGVNGVGKTTTLSKVAARFLKMERKILIAAGDTFRAAAVSQLQSWGKKVNVDVIHNPNTNSASAVIFEAMEQAKEQQKDMLLVDTAGRLHNKAHLADELKRIIKIMNNKQEGAPEEVWLVLDAQSGMNAMAQLEAFSKMANITGLIFTKADQAKKAGIVVACASRYQIPIRFLGTGESLDALKAFDAKSFIEDFCLGVFDAG